MTSAQGKVTRTVFADDAKPVFYMDAVQRGHTVYLTISNGGQHSIEALAAADPEGVMPALVSGWLDPSELFKAMNTTPDGWVANLPEPKRLRVLELFKRQRLEWHGGPAAAPIGGGSLTIVITLRRDMLRSGKELMTWRSEPKRL